MRVQVPLAAPCSNINNKKIERVKFNGKLNYYHMVEPEVIDELIRRYNAKFGTDIIAMLKEDLRPKEGVVA